MLNQCPRCCVWNKKSNTQCSACGEFFATNQRENLPQHESIGSVEFHHSSSTNFYVNTLNVYNHAEPIGRAVNSFTFSDDSWLHLQNGKFWFYLLILLPVFFSPLLFIVEVAGFFASQEGIHLNIFNLALSVLWLSALPLAMGNKEKFLDRMEFIANLQIGASLFLLVALLVIKTSLYGTSNIETILILGISGATIAMSLLAGIWARALLKGEYALRRFVNY